MHYLALLLVVFYLLSCIQLPYISWFGGFSIMTTMTKEIFNYLYFYITKILSIHNYLLVLVFVSINHKEKLIVFCLNWILLSSFKIKLFKMALFLITAFNLLRIILAILKWIHLIPIWISHNNFHSIFRIFLNKSLKVWKLSHFNKMWTCL